MFYKILKPLANIYHVILIDIIGMGGSSRPKFAINNPDDADKYLTEWLEAWRIAMGDIKGFILAGHSFGGYISGLYACKYPQYIKKLLMLSPVGIAAKSNNLDFYQKLCKQLDKQKRTKPPKWFFKCCFGCVHRLWGCKCSPFAVMRKCGKCTVKCLMSGYIKNRFKSVPKHEMVDYREYLH